MNFGDLVDRAEALACRGSRQLLGICGAPGVGKSTLSARLVHALAPRAVLVAMDGFHLAQRELERLGRADRKGAPDTFDAAGYVELLVRLRRRGPETVYAPEFRREIEEPVAGAVPVPPTVPLVVTEGNYLLLPDPPWERIRDLLDEVWFLSLPETMRRERLIARRQRYGWSYEQAVDRVLASDQANAEVVAPTRVRADLAIEANATF